MGSVEAGNDSSMLQHVVIVLVQPQDIVNVAAVVRVMANFGLSQLRLVEPAAWDPYRIEGIAHNTTEIVEAAGRFPTLADAVADCGFLLGTTGRPRAVERERLTPRDAAPLLIQAATRVSRSEQSKVAVLFGRETDGLTSEELNSCHALLTIPTAGKRSLNLGQAALVVCYELFLAAQVKADVGAPATSAVGSALTASAEPLATPAEMEPVFSALEEIISKLHPNSPPTRAAGAAARLRSLLLRACPQSVEAEALYRLFRHIVSRLS